MVVTSMMKLGELWHHLLEVRSREPVFKDIAVSEFSSSKNLHNVWLPSIRSNLTSVCIVSRSEPVEAPPVAAVPPPMTFAELAKPPNADIVATRIPRLFLKAFEVHEFDLCVG